MNIAFCHESVLPQRGGCETYIADLARRLAQDEHELHLFAKALQTDATFLVLKLMGQCLQAICQTRIIDIKQLA